MKMIGAFLLACVLLSVLQAALSVLIVAGLIVGILVRPAATVALLLFGAIANLLRVQPLAAIGLSSLLLILALLGGGRNRRANGRGIEALPALTQKPPNRGAAQSSRG